MISSVVEANSIRGWRFSGKKSENGLVSHGAGFHSGGKFVVSKPGVAYDARASDPNWKFLLMDLDRNEIGLSFFPIGPR
jgi:hypothetical protein